MGTRICGLTEWKRSTWDCGGNNPGYTWQKEQWSVECGQKDRKRTIFFVFVFLVLFVFGFALFRRGTLGKINFETENVHGLEFWISHMWQPIKRPNMYLLASLICWPMQNNNYMLRVPHTYKESQGRTRALGLLAYADIEKYLSKHLFR